MDPEGAAASADSNPLPDPDADPGLEDAGDATGAEGTYARRSLPEDLCPTPNPGEPDSVPDADHVVVDRMNSLDLEDEGETASAEVLGSDGSAPADFYRKPNPDDSDVNPGAEPARAQDTSSLDFEDPGSASGAEPPSGNGTLPSDFYMVESEIEVVDEGCQVVGDMAGTSSLGVRGAWREGSDQDGDVPHSPSSSGYAGERGSSGGLSSGIEELDDPGALSDDWSRKRHRDEDDGSISWRKRKKHYFILSHSGKPIFSRYGDEHKLAGFSATLQAIISFVENSGDHIKHVRAGNHQVVFVVKGPIYLVCISCTEEPYEALKRQLELLYGQMLLILTKSVNRCFEKNPKFDMTPLLSGTDAVFSSLIHSFSRNPATFLHAYTCLPLSFATRQAAGAILQDVADSGVLFALLLCKHKVISLVGAQKASLHPDDMLLLSNFIMASESFRTSESFSPICLPRYNPMVFLYAYVDFLDVDTYLILLTTGPDSFYHLKDCRIRIESVLVKSNVLSEVQRSVLDGGLRVEDVPVDSSLRSGSLPPHLSAEKASSELSSSNTIIGGPSGLWHFIYRSINLDQYVSSEFSSPISSSSQQKRLFRAYQNLYASMHDEGTGPHKTQFRRDGDFVILCWITQDFELYAAFDPLADKVQAIKACNRVCQWVRDLENVIFLFGASPFSW
ncbi:vacuolar fusion protein MON1 homolog [Zingiber officinale]|uniref:vacuolar fusion protein MON1 homolog n=1 Tax=Zingiber officinale TaxID=94328 RepID=UPI001C4C6B5A|nr:vacuolar fusion protein MON1 homolog [Zingiber officinale]